MLAAITFWSYPTWWPIVLLALGAMSLLAVVLALLADWRQRVRVWRTDPAGLTEPPPSHTRLYAVIMVLCGLVGLGAVAAPGSAVTPLANLLAAYAALTVGHRRQSTPGGRLGLALIGLTVITAATAWMPASSANGTLGAALAGLLLTWLARFWQQQLDGGPPWTTAGRLIPVASELSRLAVLIEIGLTAALLRSGVALTWQAVLAVVFVLAHWSLLIQEVRTAGRQRQAG